MDLSWVNFPVFPRKTHQKKGIKLINKFCTVYILMVKYMSAGMSIWSLKNGRGVDKLSSEFQMAFRRTC